MPLKTSSAAGNQLVLVECVLMWTNIGFVPAAGYILALSE
jgi:hypothetical protein